MRIVGQFCDPDRAPYRDLAVRRIRTSRDDAHQVILAPVDWPLSTSQALALMEFEHGPGAPAALPGGPDLPDFLQAAGEDPGAEPAVLAVLDRIAGRWARWGWRLGLFDAAEDARGFFDDIRSLLARRAIAPDTVAWAGAAGAGALRGFGVDPLTGAVAPAHALPGFAPVVPAAFGETGAVDSVVRLMRDTVEARSDRGGDRSADAPAVTLDPMRFLLPGGALDPAGLAAAARLAALIAEIELSTRAAGSEAQARAAHSQRPIAVGLANIGGFLMSQGLGYDSDAARALAQAVTGLVTAAVAAASAELARDLGPCPAFTVARNPVVAALTAQHAAMRRALARVASVARPDHLTATADAIASAAAPLWAAALAGAELGLRHTRFTALQPGHEHRPLPIELQSAGAGPLSAFCFDQELANGRFARMVQPSVLAGIALLGHGTAVQAAAIRHLRGHRSLAGAPGVSSASLRAQGLDEPAIARIEGALAEAQHIRHAFTRWVVGAAACDRLGLDPAQSSDYGFDLLAALGYGPAAIEAANRHTIGSDSLSGIPGLAEEDARALALPAEAVAETAMIRALNAVMSAPADPADAPASGTPHAEESASVAARPVLATAERS